MRDLIALGFEEQHTGGGCTLMAFTFPNGAYVWASESDGCFTPADDDWMICAYPADDDMPEAIFTACSGDVDALTWQVALRTACAVASNDEPEMLALAVKWAQALGLGFHPDTAGSDYHPPLSAHDVQTYSDDMIALHASYDPYEHGLAAFRALGLIEQEG